MANSSIKYELKEEVAEITIDDGRVNTFSFALVEAFHASLVKAHEDKGCRVVLLLGNSRLFSAGFDLKQLMSSKGGALVVAGMDKLLSYLFAFPKPVVIACTGSAMALGALLLCVSDFNVGPTTTIKGKAVKIGLNETALNVPMPVIGVEFARWRLPPPYFNLSMAVGTIFDGPGAKSAGFLDVVVPLGEVVSVARAQARAYVNMCPAEGFKANKLRCRRPVLDFIKGKLWQEEKARFASGTNPFAVMPARL